MGFEEAAITAKIIGIKHKIKKGFKKSIDKLGFAPRNPNTRVLWAIQDGKCYWCDFEMPLTQASKDHLIPKSKGGKRIRGNEVASCRWCNQAKGDKNYEVFVKSKWLKDRQKFVSGK